MVNINDLSNDQEELEKAKQILLLDKKINNLLKDAVCKIKLEK